MIILFLGIVWSWNLTEYLRIKRTVFVSIFFPSILACFLPSFFPPLCSLSILILFLCDKNQRWTVWKGAWFMWLSFRGFHLKMPGEIQKGVALGTCWEVAYVLAAGTERQRKRLVSTILMHTHDVLLTPT